MILQGISSINEEFNIVDIKGTKKAVQLLNSLRNLGGINCLFLDKFHSV